MNWGRWNKGNQKRKTKFLERGKDKASLSEILKDAAKRNLAGHLERFGTGKEK